MPLSASSSSARSARKRAANSLSCFSLATAASFSDFNSAMIWSSSGLKNDQDGPLVLAPCSPSSSPSWRGTGASPLVVRNAVVSMNKVEPSTAANSFDCRNFMVGRPAWAPGQHSASVPETLRAVLAGEGNRRSAIDEIINHLAFLVTQHAVMALALPGQHIFHRLTLLTGLEHSLAGLVEFDVGKMKGLLALAFALLQQ